VSCKAVGNHLPSRSVTWWLGSLASRGRGGLPANRYF